MFKVMKPDPSKKGEVFSFSLKEVTASSKKSLPPEKTAENASEKVDRLLKADMPSEKEMAAKLANMEQNAKKKGFAAGEKAGHASGMKKLEPLRQTLLNMIVEMQDLKERVLKECEEDIIAMALAMTRRILDHEVEISRETLFAYIEKGIRKIGEETRLLVRLHPHDLEAVTQASDQLTALLEAGGRFRFEPDRSLSPGDCIIEGRERVVDARPKVQLALFETAFMETKSR